MTHRLALVIWMVLIFGPSALRAGPPDEAAERRLREGAKSGLPGVVVLVAREGRILFQGAQGLADLTGGSPLTLETKFRIGSVSKQFTAAAILRLAEQGKLRVSDPLAKYFPDVPNAEKITLRHLLTHTSGLHSYTERPNFLTAVVKPIAPAELIASLRDEPPDFSPGAGFRYCNTGYFLLGEIVAKTAGQSLAEYLRTTFFEPLAMRDTGLFENASPPPGMARGYSVTKDRAVLALDWDMSWAGGAGALYSTVADLLRWNEGLYGGRVLQPESLRAMITPEPLPPGAEGLIYSFGLAISELGRFPMISHSGGLQGWSSSLVWLPAQQLTVVALSNALPPVPGFEPSVLTRELADLFLADEKAGLAPLAADRTVDPKTYPAFVGRYNYGTAVLSVTTEGDRLFAQLTGQSRFELFPKSASEFFFKVVEAKVVFIRDEKGDVVAVEHTQNGNSFRAPRLAPEPVALTEAQLEAFVGRYQYGPGAVLTVKREGTQLIAQLTGQPAIPIFATTEDTFEWRVVAAQVRFVKGADGQVTAAVHTQNGATFEAPRIP